MQAIIYRRYGPPDVLEYEELDRPIPAPGEVLIQVPAASVNPYDWHFLRGTPSFIRLFTGLRRPKSPYLGADVAAVTVAVGPGVTRLKPGDAVFGVCKGAFAEFACGKETELVPKPERLSLNKRLRLRSRASRLCRASGLWPCAARTTRAHHWGSGWRRHACRADW